MFFQGVSSVLLLDRSGNDMLCSILFLSLGFDVLTDYFNWCPSCRQKAETLAPECFLPKLFPDFRKPIPWGNIFPYLFCSFWNRIIDNFFSICYHHDQVIIHQLHWMRIMICFFHKISPFFEYLSYRLYRLIQLYHGFHYRTSVLFYFLQFISHL